MSTRELVVVKFGSESLVNGGGVDQERINNHAVRLAALHKSRDLVVVTSGAVAKAKRRTLAEGKDWQDYGRRNLAMMGSAGITVAWEEAFERVGIAAGQVLMTHLEMTDAREGPRFKGAIGRARQERIVPICNYKDFLSVSSDPYDELENIDVYTDNDRFSRDVAGILGAEALILATNGVAGYLDANGEVVRQFRTADLAAPKARDLGSSEAGTGGIVSKLENAIAARVSGMRSFICSANADFQGVLTGQEICTEVVE